MAITNCYSVRRFVCNLAGSQGVSGTTRLGDVRSESDAPRYRQGKHASGVNSSECSQEHLRDRDAFLTTDRLANSGTSSGTLDLKKEATDLEFGDITIKEEIGEDGDDICFNTGQCFEGQPAISATASHDDRILSEDEVNMFNCYNTNLCLNRFFPFN